MTYPLIVRTLREFDLITDDQFVDALVDFQKVERRHQCRFPIQRSRAI